MSVRAAALVVALGLCYHAAMLASLVTHDDAAPSLLDRLHPLSHRKGTFGEDAHGCYQAGRSVLEGRSMHDLKAVPEKVHPNAVLFSYHPFFGYLYAGVNLLFSVRGAHLAGIVAQEVLLVLVAAWLGAAFALPRAERLALLAMFLLYTPLYPEHFIGQFNIMTGAFFVAVVLADAAGKGRLAGALWAFSLTMKPALVFLGALYLRRGFLARLLLTGAFVGATGAAYFLQYPGTFARSQQVFSHGMVRVPADSLGLYTLVLDAMLRAGAMNAEHAILAARATGMLLAGLAIAVMFLDRELDATWWACVLALVYALGSHMFWEQSHVFLLPPLGILVFRYRVRAALAVWALLAMPTPFMLLRAIDRDYVRPYGAAARGFRWDTLAFGMLHHGCKAIPVLVLFVLLLRSRRGHLGLPWAPRG